MPKGAAARLIVGFEGPALEVQWMLDTLRGMWQLAGVVSPMTVANARANSLWAWLADFPAQVQIAVRPSAVTKMIGAIVSLDPDCTIQAHAGTGIIKASFMQSPFTIFLRGRLRLLVEDAGGKFGGDKQSPGATA